MTAFVLRFVEERVSPAPNESSAWFQVGKQVSKERLRITGPAHGIYGDDKVNGFDLDGLFHRRLNQADAGFAVELCGEAKLGRGEIESIGFLNTFIDKIRERMAAAAANFKNGLIADIAEEVTIFADIERSPRGQSAYAAKFRGNNVPRLLVCDETRGALRSFPV